MITLDDIAAFLNARLEVTRYAGDTNGVYRASGRAVRRLGIALEAGPGLPVWVKAQRLDALFLHRPWKLDALLLESEISETVQPEKKFEKQRLELCGVLAYHLSFDEHLTPGYNVRLADALLLTNRQLVGEKEGRPTGMIGQIAPQSFAALAAMLDAVFGGHDELIAPRHTDDFTGLAVAGAMTDALIREAHERGAQAYVTGQLRAPARLAVQDTGMSVFAVGHRRGELWGLRALAGMLRERWYGLEVIVAPENNA